MLEVAYVTGRASHAKHVKGDDYGRKGIPWFCRLGVSMRLKTPPLKIIDTKKQRRPRPAQGCRVDYYYYFYHM